MMKNFLFDITNYWYSQYIITSLSHKTFNDNIKINTTENEFIIKILSNLLFRLRDMLKTI